MGYVSAVIRFKPGLDPMFKDSEWLNSPEFQAVLASLTETVRSVIDRIEALFTEDNEDFVGEVTMRKNPIDSAKHFYAGRIIEFGIVGNLTQDWAYSLNSDNIGLEHLKFTSPAFAEPTSLDMRRIHTGLEDAGVFIFQADLPRLQVEFILSNGGCPPMADVEEGDE